MKRTLFFLMATFIITGCGVAVPITEDNKNYLNYSSDGKTVSWSEIYSYPKENREIIREWYLRSFEMTDVKDNRMIGKTRAATLPMKEVGFDPMSVIMILHKPCVVYFVVEMKEDRCRVTVNDIIWDTEMAVTSRSGGIGITQGIGSMTLNEIAVSNGAWRPAFYKNSGPQLNSMLDYLFKPKTEGKEYLNDNW